MKRIDQEVLAVIGSMEVDGNAARIYGGLTNGKLDPKLYKAVDKVLDALGGKWNRNHRFGTEKGAHVFDSDPRDAFEGVLAIRTYADAKQDFGAFFTPDRLADHVAELANVAAEMDVLERLSLTLVEKQKANVDVLHRKDAVGLWNAKIIHGDFLEMAPVERFDAIIMNTPFARQADLDHVAHAHRFLKPDGRLVAIMAASVRWRQNRKAEAFKRDILDRFLVQMADNDAGAFKASGTGDDRPQEVVDKTVSHVYIYTSMTKSKQERSSVQLPSEEEPCRSLTRSP